MMAYICEDCLDMHWAKCNNRSPSTITYMLKTATGIAFVGPGHPMFCHYACTDDKAIYLNKEWVDTSPMLWVCFAILHEATHAMLGHCRLLKSWRKRGQILGYPYIEDVAQISLDYAVNDLACRAGWRDGMPDFAVYEPEFVDIFMSEEEGYVKTYQRMVRETPSPPPSSGEPDQPSGSPGSKPSGEGSLPGGGAHDLREPADDAIPESRRIGALVEAIQQIGEAAMAGSDQRGVGSGQFRQLLERLKPSYVDWRSQIKRTMRAASGNDYTSWRRLRARSWANGVALPVRAGYRAGLVVSARDTSGSMYDYELQALGAAFGEVYQQARPLRMLCLDVDYVVQSAVEIKDASQLRREVSKGLGKQVAGRGGTSMCSIFAWLKEQELQPDCLIIMTDMGTDFPTDISPCKDLLWVATRPGIIAPVGRTVYANIPPS